ncbi:hypothetical protein E0500_011865 [Streptomyces sp. KM273126]|uniref:hypothetical protein n=1 Tax=Streptomyces sp. KM273126 TaxID=2545247 RepID=UPI00103F482B|nr:hypothetical protein [Streptomyces sp. KM273126]MBA2808088.1 hypothetical protein [Streptomyces sp. KM273126]
MSVTEQYILDTYRAQRLGEPAPPAPGAHDWEVVRELRDHRRFRAAVAGGTARGRIRSAAARLLRTRP